LQVLQALSRQELATGPVLQLSLVVTSVQLIDKGGDLALKGCAYMVA
jgi:hypothetical protein